MFILEKLFVTDTSLTVLLNKIMEEYFENMEGQWKNYD